MMEPLLEVFTVANAQKPLPTSAEIIGFLVKCFELELDRHVSGRTFRNFVAGKRVSDGTREDIFNAFILPLVDWLLSLPAESRPSASVDQLADGLRQLLMQHARRWDDLVDQLAPGAASKRVPLAPVIALRLTVVDLACRISSLLVIWGVPPLKELTPAWVEANPTGQALRALLKHAKLTREQLALKLRVSKPALDKWLDGKKFPPAERIDEMVQVCIGEGDPEFVRSYLRQLRLLSRFRKQLAAHVGDDELEGLGRALLRITGALQAAIRKLSFHPAEYRDRWLGELLVHGSSSSPARCLLPQIARDEEDPTWSGLIISAAGDWSARIAPAHEMASHLADVERMMDENRFRHIGPEDLNRELLLLLQTAPAERIPEYLHSFRAGSPEERLQMVGGFLYGYFEHARSFGLEEKLEAIQAFSKLSECLLVSRPSNDDMQAKTRVLVQVCHLVRVGLASEVYSVSLREGKFDVARLAGRALIEAISEMAEPPPELLELRQEMEAMDAALGFIERLAPQEAAQAKQMLVEHLGRQP